MKKTILLLPCLLYTFYGAFAQCANERNVFAFEYNNKTYELIRENKTWADAAACAASRGGYLAEINSAEENRAVFDFLTSANIQSHDTKAPDGFSSYVWLGGNDISAEGAWVWNGNNDSAFTQFWQGTASGSAVNGHYTNWGNEPDNWGNGSGQDGLGMAVVNWPLGRAGQWNDVHHENILYFVVEYNSLLRSGNNFTENTVILYPNPARDVVSIEALNDDLAHVAIYSVDGRLVKLLKKEALAGNKLPIEALPPGIYTVSLYTVNGKTIVQKLVKQ